MTREEAIKELKEDKMLYETDVCHAGDGTLDGRLLEALDMAIEVLQADAVQIVYCMDCAKSVPLDEHGALWKCKAHDRTTLRHSYCSHGERREPHGFTADEWYRDNFGDSNGK